MAAQHLTVLSSPGFPQQFESAFARFQGTIERVLTSSQLGTCCHETVVLRGATGEENEFFPCSEVAVVHDLPSDMQFCMTHFVVTNSEAGRG